MFWPALSVAAAAEADPERVRLGVRLLGEALEDPEVALSYGGDGLGGEIAATVPVVGPIHVTLEAGYLRRGGHLVTAAGGAGAASSFWYLPMSLPVSWVADLGAVQLGAGVGPTYLLFAEPEVSNGADIVESGGKFGFVVNARASIATKMVRASLHDPDRGPRSLDVTIGIGYRHAFANLFGPDAGQGHDLSAARAALGIELVY